MRIAIMTTALDSFEKPMAQGLKRMFDTLRVPSKIFWKGHKIFEKIHPRLELSAEGLRRQYSNLIKAAAMIELASYNIIVIVSTIPGGFLKEDHSFIEVLRRIFPRKPIVLYSTSYLPTRGGWYRTIKEKSAKNFGMERYDYYFSASVVSEVPMPDGENPVSIVGVNLEDGSLRADTKREFLALLDFERTNCMKERATMIQALEETNTKYVVLSGHYAIDDIRSIYRSVSAYFIAHRESFGLPICELQACGAYILTPYANWAPSHWIKDVKAKGEGRLSDNFVIYENDLGVLKRKLREIKASYDPFKVVADFMHHHPQFYYGDLSELRKFIRGIEAGRITGRSHLAYAPINEKIPDWTREPDVRDRVATPQMVPVGGQLASR